MIPLTMFLLAWFLLLGVFGFMAFISVFQMLRYGIRSPGTYLPTIIFFVITVVTLFGTSLQLMSVDWDQNISLMPEGGQDAVILFTP